jgi:CDP-diacylglycerol--serine O-phosphatidyltransferase
MNSTASTGQSQGGEMNALKWAKSSIAYRTWSVFSFYFTYLSHQHFSIGTFVSLLIFPQVTFGLAPVMMLYSIGFRTPVDQIALAFFVICCVARLARFNVTTEVPKSADGKVLYFEGLNSTYSGMIVSTAALVCAWLDRTSEGILFKVFFHGTWCEFHPAMVFVIAISATMVSKRLKLRAVGLFVIPIVTVVVYAGCWSLSPPQF